MAQDLAACILFRSPDNGFPIWPTLNAISCVRSLSALAPFRCNGAALLFRVSQECRKH